MIGEAFYRIEIIGRWFTPSTVLIAGVSIRSWVLLAVGIVLALLLNVDVLVKRSEFWKPRSRKISAGLLFPMLLIGYFWIPNPLKENHLPMLFLLLAYGFLIAVSEGICQRHMDS